MNSRPTHIALTDEDLRPPQRPNLHVDLPSPRTGEAPPALSPLDAVALQYRLLAKRFEEPKENGRRISRLRHSDVAKEISSRPDYFKMLSSFSENDGSEDDGEKVPGSSEGSKGGLVPAVAADKDRPTSFYPEMGHATRQERHERPLSTPFETPAEYMDAQNEIPRSPNPDYFGIAMPRAASPEAVDNKLFNLQTPTPIMTPSLTSSVDSVQSSKPQPPPLRTYTNGSTRSQRSLAPPRSPVYPKSPRSMQSIRSVPADGRDEELSVRPIPLSPLDRKFSGSSVSISRPQSPLSPYMGAMPRSPSTMSDYSMNGSQRRNFSRPLSGHGSRYDHERKISASSKSSYDTRPSTDLPRRLPSTASGHPYLSSNPPSRQASGDDTNVPFAAPPPFPTSINGEKPGLGTDTSYTYATFTLPRGRTVERNSRGTRDSWIQGQFRWEGEGGAQPLDLEAPPKALRERTNSDSAALKPPPRLEESLARSLKTPRESKQRQLRDRAGSNAGDRSRSVPKTLSKASALHKATPSVRTHNTASSERTIVPIPLHERSTSTELTPEEHLELGIETHTNGELSKSTYHLRLAAKAGLPTGMLLYALACRHGWGMRPNQAEGVTWLRKAIDSAGLEVADVEASLLSSPNPSTSTISTKDPVAENQARKTRKAQFALAVYELGISYMNGWGCTKDKALAVSCFEMAGNWGDCDALAEAAFCYTQGNGCKKDLRKAAMLYRKAEEGGMSMAGNSW